MIETPKIVETEAQLLAAIKLVVDCEAMKEVMGPGIHEVMQTVAAQGIGPTGPWLAHHFRRPSDVFDFEIAVPVGATVVATGRVEASQLPATKVARTVYRGGYEGLGQAWGELEAWIAAQGLTPGTDFWEVYLVGPESEDDPAAYCTELNRPIVD